jgi:hypothetical protein
MNHPQPALLTAGVDDPARRLIWATVEQSLTDLRDQRQRGSAAAFLADVLPALAPDIPAAAVDDTIQHWTQNKYSRQAAARRAEEDAGAVHHSRVSR